MEETPVGVIKRTWGVMEETHPMRESSSTETRSLRPRHVSPAAMSQAGQGWTGEAVSEYPESPVPYTRPCQGSCWAGKARVGTNRHGHTRSCDRANTHKWCAEARTCTHLCPGLVNAFQPQIPWLQGLKGPTRATRAPPGTPVFPCQARRKV